MTFKPLARFTVSISIICLAAASPTRADVPVLECNSEEAQPHSEQSFTQGLEMNEGWLYESSGQYGKSFVSRYRAADNSQLTQLDLPRDVFAEGLTLVDGRIYLISWKSGTGWILDAQTLSVEKQFSYDGEGWGIAYDGESIIMSDGSSLLRFYHPGTFELINTLTIKHNGKKFDNMNELEFVDGVLWANQWYSNSIYAIDLARGEVLAEMQCSGLRDMAKATQSEQVLNGIAYDKTTDSFWLTGKYWPVRYRVIRPLLPAE